MGAFMNLLFAWRYFKSKKSANAINIIAWISVLAIAVGAAALIIVLSVFNGFEDLVKNLYSDFYADIRIAPAQGKFTTFTQPALQRIQAIQGVDKLTTVVEEKAVLVNGDYQAIVYLKGVDENYAAVNKLSNHIVAGEYKTGTTDAPALVVGQGIESAVGADPDNKLSNLIIYLPNRNATKFNSMDAMHSMNVTASGVFMVQEEFDDKYAFTNLTFVQYMLDLKPDEFSSIELSVKPGTDANAVKQELQNMLGKNFLVQTRYEQNQSLFTVMQIEKWVIYAILAIILLVASFNMVGALTMLVLEKQKDIAVLKAMGANDRRIKNIFLGEGFLLAGIGGAGGMLLAFLVCTAQEYFHIIKLEGGTFIIDYYPVKMNVQDFLLVTFTVFVEALMAAWIPSRKASAQMFSLKS